MKTDLYRTLKHEYPKLQLNGYILFILIYDIVVVFFLCNLHYYFSNIFK